MPQVTREQLYSDTRDFMDATNSGRWSDAIVEAVVDSVFDAEWSNLLAAAPYYRAAARSVTTDSNGQFALTDLNSGSGDSAQNWYRIITVTDGNYIYDQSRYQDVPLATTAGYPVPYQWDRLYYILGTNVQVLPVAASTALTVMVNYKPPVPSALSADSVTVDYPENGHLIIAWESAARLLMKGGAETQAARDLMELARVDRDALLLDIQRQTINPLRVMPLDDASDWAGT